LAIYATSTDYDSNAEVSREFFATMQNKMHWAAHGHTAAEVVAKRASARKRNVGMTNFPGDRPLKRDAAVAKNNLAKEELEALNLIVSLYLDFAELQALNKRPMTMAAWVAKLDDFLKLSERGILTHAGSVSQEDARAKAAAEYEKWRVTEANKESVAERDFAKAIEATKTLEPKVRKRKRG
jgi:hypothetical protein